MSRAMGDTRETKQTPSRQARSVVARVAKGNGTGKERRFTGTFIVGRAADCGLRISDPAVDPHHAQILFDGIVWWVRHVGGAAGTYVDGSPIQLVPLAGEAKLELGKGGPVVSLRLAEAGASEADEAEEGGKASKPGKAGKPDDKAGKARKADESAGDAEPSASTPGSGTGRELTEAEIIQRYMRPVGDGPAGKQTMMFRAAFQSVQKKSSRRYQVIIGASLLVLVIAGAVIAYQRQKLHTLRASAERLFYAMKTIELRTSQLEELAMMNADPGQVAALTESREKLKNMESEYDAFVRELGVYGRVSERQRYILRVARRFGECEVNIPKAFIAEVERYIEKWRENDRLGNALRKAKQNGYGAVITRVFSQGNLPPHYVYLALQESNFNDRAVGPSTRYGFAKGMWQFISLTGHKYGLEIGPLYDQAVYDPSDERFDWPKATRAAVKYIRELTTTEAQASGLLAMASYNWGEDKVRAIIASMPQNPQERNFWRLLAHPDVPGETYDYVLSIFSAAVICENPKDFGFDVECPIPPRPPIDELGRDRVD